MTFILLKKVLITCTIIELFPLQKFYYNDKMPVLSPLLHIGPVSLTLLRREFPTDTVGRIVRIFIAHVSGLVYMLFSKKEFPATNVEVPPLIEY